MRCTLVCDGASDRALLSILAWTLWQLGVRTELDSVWANFQGVRVRPVTLREKIIAALELYPCDIIFIHRDSEAESPELRFAEVEEAIAALTDLPPRVAIVPVRMMESWLLTSETAIRQAAGNPNGQISLALPATATIEQIPDCKEELFKLLRNASELSGRRRQNFDVYAARTLVAQYTESFSTLRELPSYRKFEADLRRVVQAYHLDTWI